MKIYPKKFVAGDAAVAKKNVYFVDGTKHVMGQHIPVSDSNSAYFNVNHLDYDKTKQLSNTLKNKGKQLWDTKSN